MGKGFVDTLDDLCSMVYRDAEFATAACAAQEVGFDLVRVEVIEELDEVGRHDMGEQGKGKGKEAGARLTYGIFKATSSAEGWTVVVL